MSSLDAQAIAREVARQTGTLDAAAGLTRRDRFRLAALRYLGGVDAAEAGRPPAGLVDFESEEPDLHDMTIAIRSACIGDNLMKMPPQEMPEKKAGEAIAECAKCGKQLYDYMGGHYCVDGWRP